MKQDQDGSSRAASPVKLTLRAGGVAENAAGVDILERLTLDNRRRLLVVGSNGRRLLLGVTPSGSRTLYVLPDAPALAAPREDVGRALEAGARGQMSAMTIGVVTLLALASLGGLARRAAPVRARSAPTVASPEVPALPIVPPSAVVPHATDPAPIASATPIRPTFGTVRGDPNHRLWIDGRLVSGSRADVRCGAHTVQVGSAGEVRPIDVPCGGSLDASAQARTLKSTITSPERSP
jgi:hypothetical protein